ncbi:hypothetical protein BDZ91DRAFT_744119, partial [Kalaharituber pfeilii]
MLHHTLSNSVLYWAQGRVAWAPNTISAQHAPVRIRYTFTGIVSYSSLFLAFLALFLFPF